MASTFTQRGIRS
jgi:hypothetical protein